MGAALTILFLPGDQTSKDVVANILLMVVVLIIKLLLVDLQTKAVAASTLLTAVVQIITLQLQDLTTWAALATLTSSVAALMGSLPPGVLAIKVVVASTQNLVVVLTEEHQLLMHPKIALVQPLNMVVAWTESKLQKMMTLEDVILNLSTKENFALYQKHWENAAISLLNGTLTWNMVDALDFGMEIVEAMVIDFPVMKNVKQLVLKQKEEKGVTFPKSKALAKVIILDGTMTGKEKLAPSLFTAAVLETQTDLKQEKSVMNYVELRSILMLVIRNWNLDLVQATILVGTLTKKLKHVQHLIMVAAKGPKTTSSLNQPVK